MKGGWSVTVKTVCFDEGLGEAALPPATCIFRLRVVMRPLSTLRQKLCQTVDTDQACFPVAWDGGAGARGCESDPPCTRFRSLFARGCKLVSEGVPYQASERQAAVIGGTMCGRCGESHKKKHLLSLLTFTFLI